MPREPQDKGNPVLPKLAKGEKIKLKGFKDREDLNQTASEFVRARNNIKKTEKKLSREINSLEKEIKNQLNYQAKFGEDLDDNLDQQIEQVKREIELAEEDAEQEESALSDNPGVIRGLRDLLRAKEDSQSLETSSDEPGITDSARTDNTHTSSDFSDTSSENRLPSISSCDSVDIGGSNIKDKKELSEEFKFETLDPKLEEAQVVKKVVRRMAPAAIKAQDNLPDLPISLDKASTNNFESRVDKLKALRNNSSDEDIKPTKSDLPKPGR